LKFSKVCAKIGQEKMHEQVRVAVKESGTLDEVRDNILNLLKHMVDAEGVTQIGYVAAIITSDGPEKIPQNLERLQRYTEHVRKTQSYPVFSATDVFTDELFERLFAAGFKNEDWTVFWREVLGEAYVTDMFMTPRWEESKGASDEYQIAKRTGKTLHYFNYQIDSIER